MMKPDKWQASELLNKKPIIIMTKTIISAGLLTVAAGAALAGPTAPIQGRTFADAQVSISNPTLAELAVPQTKIHAMMMHQELSDTVSLAGGDVAMGGELNLLAVQIEYALSERLSLVASKDGYIQYKPNNGALPNAGEEGFANLAAGLKYAFIYDTANLFAASITGIVELPTGNRDVFQGYGKGALNLTVSTLKMYDKWQFSTATGVHIPFDTDAESFTGFSSFHASYALTERFTPIAELNIFQTFHDGDGSEQGAYSLTDFEGGDLVNLGSSNASENSTIVTAALGFRYKLDERASLGLAYEVPLTNEKDNLMKSRLTLDLVYKF